MNTVPRTTIEQWVVLRVIFETGSFANAAERLHRSQSSVSYAVARLQERLGIVLLQVQGRRAQLTEAGQALLAEAIPLIDDLARLEKRADFLAAGNEANIHLLIDSIFPRSHLFEVLGNFRTAYPHVRVNLREVVRQAAPDPRAEPFDLSVTIWDPQSRTSQRILDIDLVAVAHRDHPLHGRSSAKLTQATLSRHLLVFIQGQGWNSGLIDAASVDRQIWQVSTVEAAVEAVCRGLCYGWLPQHSIEREVASGMLLVLPLPVGSTRRISLGLSYADQEQAGPATREMARLLLAPR